MYQHFQHRQLHGHGPMMQPLGNSPPMMNPGLMNMDYLVPNMLPRNVPLQAMSSENHNNIPRHSHMSSSFGREGISGGSDVNSYVALTEATTTRPQQAPNSTSHLHSFEQPYFSNPAATAWPGWRGASALSPFPYPMPTNHSILKQCSQEISMHDRKMQVHQSRTRTP